MNGVFLAALVGLWFAHAYRIARAVPKAAVPPPGLTPRTHWPRVSFLVPAWNARDHIPEFLAAYRALEYPEKELILCAGGPDGSYAVAKALEGEGVTVLEQHAGEGKQRALARCYARATGRLLYLTDIDCRPSDAVVGAVLEPLLRGEAPAATGPSRPLDAQLQRPFVQLEWAVERMPLPETVTPVTGLLGRNAAVTREALEAAGGFATPAPSGTDYTLAKELERAGQRILFVPGAYMPSEYPERLGVYVHKQARWVRNVFVLGWRYRAWLEVRAVARTLALPYLLLGSAALGGMGVELGWWGVALLGSHALLNRLYYQRRAALGLDLGAAALHFAADVWAAARAGWQVLRRRWTW